MTRTTPPRAANQKSRQLQGAGPCREHPKEHCRCVFSGQCGWRCRCSLCAGWRQAEARAR